MEDSVNLTSSKTVALWAVEAAENEPILGGPDIPFEAATAELKNRRPLDIVGDISIGTQCPIFWMSGADNPKGAWIRESVIRQHPGG